MIRTRNLPYLTAARDTAAPSFKQHYRLQFFAFWYFMIPNLELFLQRGCRPSDGSGGLISLKLPTLYGACGTAFIVYLN